MWRIIVQSSLNLWDGGSGGILSVSGIVVEKMKGLGPLSSSASVIFGLNSDRADCWVEHGLWWRSSRKTGHSPIPGGVLAATTVP